MSLQEEQLHQYFETAWQDGYGCATRPDYKKRTDLHVKRTMVVIKKAEIKARIDELGQIRAYLNDEEAKQVKTTLQPYTRTQNLLDRIKELEQQLKVLDE